MNSEDIKINVDCSENISIKPQITVESNKSTVTVKILLELKNGNDVRVANVLTSISESPKLQKDVKPSILTPQDMVEKFKRHNGINDFGNIVKPCW